MQIAFKALGRKKPGEMNKTEAEHADHLKQLESVGEILCFGFEEFTFKLANDLRYTPDFWVLRTDLHLEFHEVKGGFITDDGRDKLKMAASKYHFLTFKRYQKKSRKEGWVVTEMKA